MRKRKEKTAVDKAMDLLFESGVDGTAILGQGGLLKELTKGILERALKAEMEDHFRGTSLMSDLRVRMPEMAAIQKRRQEQGAFEIEAPTEVEPL